MSVNVTRQPASSLSVVRVPVPATTANSANVVKEGK